jgi:Short C-terminal domain
MLLDGARAARVPERDVSVKNAAAPQTRRSRMIAGPIIALLALIGLVAIFVWIVDWASGGGERRRSALDILDERFAKGEIDRAEYEEKRKLIRDRSGAS